MELKPWCFRKPAHGHFYHYCGDCRHYEHVRDVGCAQLGVCHAITGEETEQDAYDKPCELWEGVKRE